MRGHSGYSVAFLLRDLGEGGAERASLSLANAFAREGMRVTLLVQNRRGPLIPEIDDRIETVDLKGSYIKLFSWLKTSEIDFLLPVYSAMSALLAKRVLRADWRVIVSQHNMFTLDRGPVQTKLRFMRCRALYPYASACVCVSGGVAGEMRSLDIIENEKIRVIYNPAVTDRLTDMADEPLSHAWFAEGEPPVILAVGRLGDQKDFATLIKAFTLLPPRDPGPRLLILGEGKQRPMLEKLVRDNNLETRVSLPGYVPNPYPYMKRAAVLAVTSRFEGFCLVVAEALACGCNVASVDCKSGPGEILDGGRYGRLAKVGDARSVSAAIDEALKCPIPPETLKARAAFFSAGRAVEEYKNLFRDLTPRGNSI